MTRRKYTPAEEREVARMYAGGAPLADIRDRFGGSTDAIHSCVKRHGLEMRPQRRPQRQFSDDEVAEMARLWEAGESQTAIAKQLGTAQVVVSRVLRSAGITPVARAKHLSGSQHGSWKGGRIRMGREGYLGVLVDPSDALASMRNRMGYVPEHRLVMARHLGRPLTSTETVHHINSDKQDNRIENLQLRQGKHGKGNVMVCADCGSRNVESRPLATQD